MKKVLTALGVSLTLLISCDTSDIKAEDNSRFKGFKNDEDIRIIVDEETGCKYIYTNVGFGNVRTNALSPLMKNKDEVDCGQ